MTYRLTNEFWFILVCLVLLLIGIVMVVTGGRDVLNNLAFQKVDAFVDKCLASEKYTREECITLAGDRFSDDSR